MKPNELHLLRAASDPQISPDGQTTAFVVSTPNTEDDRYDREIWLASADVRRFTTGPGDQNPRWSPDGRCLAFLRAVDDKPAQVALIPVGGGEAETISNFKHGAEAVEWSPDGSTLVVVAVTPIEEWADLEDDEIARRPRRITQVPFRFDGMGWIHDRKRHLWLINPDDSDDPHCLTPGEFDETSPAWSPDGSTIAFITDHAPNKGLTSGNDVFEVNVDNGQTTRAVPRGFWNVISYRSDGALHLLGNVETTYPVNGYLYRREEDGTLTNLTGHTDRSSVGLVAGTPRIEWSGDRAITGYEDSGSFGVISVTPDGEVAHPVTGEQMVTGFDVDSGGVIFTASRWDSPGELYLDDEVLSSLSEPEANWIKPTHLRVTSSGNDVDAWVYLPDGDASVPLLLNVHGGPASQYGFGLFDEFQVYVSAGYGVVACNPRGSSGRGEEWLEAIKGDSWGGVDVEDVIAVTDAALEQFPRLDPNRMGVMGGSYGGYFASWIIGHEDRWKSAVVERALTVWSSFSGTSDIAGVFAENYLGIDYPHAWDTWWQKSPLSVAENVTTPTLILHSEDDWRCPIEQAEQYFMALLRNGTTTEFIRFPGEGHEMSRGGKPRHRQERFEAILDWHARHLA
jgi:dipeptidyl aminopeptidase/acylaminoacyl peptidase